ncbi:DUF3301 domain-containing protein [Pseudidiomarina gelatinasegens]|uniref:DUF3301 domain-containing protein n=1 Tax=Pseudidiomarina gelatinasegens TaxID=2487740 RepID=A0A443Z6G3_9GAMM|nr:DUF3301 domain-containing protein [Pseudidiomarina gelatinasegens]RWU12314.1 DUF3301 domain-containing protein [Pseudidiomarina gelatinasegens]
MVLADAIALLLVGFVVLIFWQGRRQAEQARRYVEQYCKQQQLQFLDIAWQGGRPAKLQRHLGWLSRYEFGFSSDGESRYNGQATLLNMRLVEITTPPHRVPSP